MYTIMSQFWICNEVDTGNGYDTYERKCGKHSRSHFRNTFHSKTELDHHTFRMTRHSSIHNVVGEWEERQKFEKLLAAMVRMKEREKKGDIRRLDLVLRGAMSMRWNAILWWRIHLCPFARLLLSSTTLVVVPVWLRMWHFDSTSTSNEREREGYRHVPAERHLNWKFFIVLLHLTLTVIAFLSLRAPIVWVFFRWNLHTLLLLVSESASNWMKNFLRKMETCFKAEILSAAARKNVMFVAPLLCSRRHHHLFLCVEHGKFSFFLPY